MKKIITLFKKIEDTMPSYANKEALLELALQNAYLLGKQGTPFNDDEAA